MSEGLSRRRVGAASSPAPASTSTFDGPAASSSNAPKKQPVTSAAAGSGAVEGRNKVAYDPRDFENGGEAEQMPRLTIMEEVLLLGLKDKQVGQLA
jgi:Golgi phosphoprotein 3